MLKRPAMEKMMIVAAVLALVALQTAQAQQPSLQGAWQPQRYLLKDGGELAVTGLIFFAEKDWTVLFFVIDEEAQPKRGSGEGGTYRLTGDSLTFRHQYHLSAGEATGSLPDSPVRMEIQDAAEAASEPCTIDLSNDRLTIHFPSGNAMTFRRRSGMGQ